MDHKYKVFFIVGSYRLIAEKFSARETYLKGDVYNDRDTNQPIGTVVDIKKQVDAILIDVKITLP